MATKAHKLLTGADLHEPKGVETASAGQAYISNGSGSGAWTTIAVEVGFSTGDVKYSFKLNPDAGWILANDGTIGNVSSGASTRAAADCQALFYLLWNNLPDAFAPVGGGRGGSAAADWAANKVISVPKTLGKVLGVAGAGVGLTARALGQGVGEEAHTLTAAESAVLTYSSTDSGHVHGPGIGTNYVTYSSGLGPNSLSAGSTVQTSSSGTGTASAIITTTSNAGGQAHNIVQPTIFLNLMVKL